MLNPHSGHDTKILKGILTQITFYVFEKQAIKEIFFKTQILDLANMQQQV